MKSYIGPFAKEFFTAFKTGDDSTISTIDPSGVALIGIQQLSIENKELKSEVENLKSEMAEIKKLLAENYFKNSFTVELKNENTNNVLFNAVPNPAGTNTTIKYEIVKPFHDAQILITDNTGAILLPIKLSRQMGEITINVASLHAGIYTYSLLVDGIKTDSKLFSVIK
jgi:hypothetical protein